MSTVISFTRAPRTNSNFMRTYTGRKFWPLNPNSADISIEDVAHHLSQECRFNGATYCHYSVAEHALRVSRLVERMVMEQQGVRDEITLRVTREVALWGLHHDDSEAYLKDMIRPVKHYPGLGELYRAVEREVMNEVIEALDLMPHMPYIVKQADDILTHTEGRDLVKDFEVPPGAETLPERIYPCADPHLVEVEFIRRHHALMNARKVASLAHEQP